MLQCLLGLWAFPMLAIPNVAAQEQRRPVLITEASYALRVAGELPGTESVTGPSLVNLNTSLGFLIPVRPRIGLGAVVTAGLQDELYLAVGPRIRFHASPVIAVDLTPQYVVAGGRLGNGRSMLDASVMYRDRIGLSVLFGSAWNLRVASTIPDYTVDEVNRPSLYAGIRLGSKPGRWGMAVDGVALAGLFGLVLLACGNGACD